MKTILNMDKNDRLWMPCPPFYPHRSEWGKVLRYGITSAKGKQGKPLAVWQHYRHAILSYSNVVVENAQPNGRSD